LLQSNSEEIKRISFIQHYKRKAVESKATIQPFATERGEVAIHDEEVQKDTMSTKERYLCRVKGHCNKTRPGYEEQQSGEPKGPQFDRSK
jgi:hypothetical protein